VRLSSVLTRFANVFRFHPNRFPQPFLPLSTVLGAGGEQEAGQQVKSTPPQWQRQ